MALSPMMKQYQEVKEQYKDCVLMYRLGDFYEMFFDDAIEVSRILGLTLTGRDCGLDERAPMCGVPYHALNTYLAELVEQGKKVAICEQLTDAKKGEIVKRGVIRVVTPGTLIDLDLLDTKKNNYIATVSQESGVFSVAWADISTGELSVTSGKNKGDLSELAEMLTKIMPSEIITTSEISKYNIVEVSRGMLPKLLQYRDFAFELKTAEKKIKSQFEVLSLEPYGIERNKGAISATGALLEYIEDTQKRKLEHFLTINYVNKANHMVIDSNTRRNLELLYSNRDGKRNGTLYSMLNKTKTPMGSRLLGKWIEEPLIDEHKLSKRHEAVSVLVDDYYNRDELAEVLKSVRDIERLASKIAYRNANPADLLNIRSSLEVLPKIKNVLNKINSPLINEINDGIDDFKELYDYLVASIDDEATSQTKDGGYIKDGFNEELDEYRNIKQHASELIHEMEAVERENSGIKNLKIGNNRVFGYYIEVTKGNQLNVPLSYVRKQTIANAERYITKELKELEEKIQGAETSAIRIEQQLLQQVLDVCYVNVQPLLKTAKCISAIDVLTAFAVVAYKYNYVRPSVNNNNTAINIINGRHPVVERLLSNNDFVANDTYIDSEESRTMILTGPNMAGKSTYMRQVALIAIMAQVGSFVPCESCELPILDRVFTRVGASDNLLLDQSTFMVEMIEVSNILNNATKNSLIILDEVGRGTSTLDGLSIAFAVTKHITNNIKAKTLFATHYHELTELEGLLSGVRNYRISVKEVDKGIIFLRKIVRGGANRSFGIEVASLAGLPKVVIKEAKKILKELESKEIIKSDKQLSMDSIIMQDEEITDYSSIAEQLKAIDLDDISPREALNILTRLKEEVEEI